jgi:monoamine oxidase
LNGLTAGWLLQGKGKKVLVLEARDRLGGRTYTVERTYRGNPTWFDLGAHFIGDEEFQSDVWDLVEQLSLDIFPQYEGPATTPPTPPSWDGLAADLLATQQGAQAFIGTMVPETEEGQYFLGLLLKMTSDFPLAAPQDYPDASALDAVSVWDWILAQKAPNGKPAPEETLAALQMLCLVGFSAEPQQINMLWFLFYLASSGGLERFQVVRWPVQGAQGFRLVYGAQSISEALEAAMSFEDPDCIRIRTPVASVYSSKNGVRVTTDDGEEFVGRAFLAAMSPQLSQLIAYDPPLPPARVAAANAMENGDIIMTFVTFTRPFWREDTTRYPNGTVNGQPTENISRWGLSGNVLFLDGPVVWMMDNSTYEGQAALFAFICGDAARKLAGQPLEVRRKTVLQQMQLVFGDDVGACFQDYNEQNWNAEPYSKGCPAAHFTPGTFLSSINQVLLSQMPPDAFGRIFFASTEAAELSNGYMSGAVWAGKKVADNILTLLSSR